MAKIDNIYEAVDDFGLITSAEATELGMSRTEIVQQANMGKLIRVARGVYRAPVWPAQQEAPYAIAVKAVGQGAFLYGESVIALLELAPTDPAKMYVASPKRCRRNLGEDMQVMRVDDAHPVLIKGIFCQPVADAIPAAAKTMGQERAQQAIQEALAQGYITEEEAAAVAEVLAPR